MVKIAAFVKLISLFKHNVLEALVRPAAFPVLTRISYIELILLCIGPTTYKIPSSLLVNMSNISWGQT